MLNLAVLLGGEVSPGATIPGLVLVTIADEKRQTYTNPSTRAIAHRLMQISIRHPSLLLAPLPVGAAKFGEISLGPCTAATAPWTHVVPQLLLLPRRKIPPSPSESKLSDRKLASVIR